MRKICNINLEQRGEIFEKIDAYCKEVARKLKPETIILFGSFAKDDVNEGSDIDILVISNFKENFLDRIKVLLDLNRFKIPVEPIGYTPEEYAKMKKERNSFYEEVIQDCKVLYGTLPK